MQQFPIACLCALLLMMPNHAASQTTITFSLPGSVLLEMVRIPAGTFLMGRYPGEQDSYPKEDPQHMVTIGYDFYLGEYELTKRQWEAVMGTTPWAGRIFVINYPESPAVYVSWNDAQTFLTALNTHLAATGQDSHIVRLPSEAEWEYACRAGTTTRFYWGDDPLYTQIADHAWYSGNAFDGGDYYARVAGLKLANAWGVHDMCGNVWEWCQDLFHHNYNGAPTDGSAWWEAPTYWQYVLRGGSCNYPPMCCRSAFRLSTEPSNRAGSFGFRVLAFTPNYALENLAAKNWMLYE